MLNNKLKYFVFDIVVCCDKFYVVREVGSIWYLGVGSCWFEEKWVCWMVCGRYMFFFLL